MPTVLGLCGLGDSIPAEVQGRNFAPLFFDEKAEIVRPTGALYIQNVDGDKDENGLVQTYFPSSRGIKTAQYTLALYIDRDTKQLKKSLLFDDVKIHINCITCLWKKIRRLWHNFAVKWELC